MKRILVTGATGFIGNYVIQELLHYNYDVIATSASAIKARQASWFDRVAYKPFLFEEWNPTTNYYDFFNKPDHLIHLAWQGLPNYKDAFHIEINLPAHKAFLNNLVSNGLQDVTVTGTCLEYGMQEGCLRENLPAFPANPYAKAKDELRKFIGLLQDKYLFVFRWIRLFYMYGKGQNTKSLLSQLEQAIESGDQNFNMSGGEQIRDFLPVEKVAEYIVKIALQQKVTGIINCCSGKPISVKQLVEEYLEKNKKTIKLNLGYYPYPDYEPMHFWGDDTKLKTILHHERSN